MTSLRGWAEHNTHTFTDTTCQQLLPLLETSSQWEFVFPFGLKTSRECSHEHLKPQQLLFSPTLFTLWIPAWLEQLLSKHSPLSHLSPSQNTRLRWLFCFWIPVNIFIPPRGGSCTIMYDEELLTIFVLAWYLVTLHEEVGEGRGVSVPFLKFTWTCVQTAWRGRATFREWVSPHPPTRQTRFLDIAG